METYAMIEPLTLQELRFTVTPVFTEAEIALGRALGWTEEELTPVPEFYGLTDEQIAALPVIDDPTEDMTEAEFDAYMAPLVAESDAMEAQWEREWESRAPQRAARAIYIKACEAARVIAEMAPKGSRGDIYYAVFPAQLQIAKLHFSALAESVAAKAQGTAAVSAAPETVAFPPDYDSDARIGLVGEFVGYALPFSEADVNCLLGQGIAVLGNFFGHINFAAFGAERHYGNLNVLTIGETSAGKGQGGNLVESFAKAVSASWHQKSFKFSAASGEGLIRMLANPAEPRVVLKVTEMVILFDSMRREGSTLSGYLRAGYDGTNIEINRAKESDSTYASDYLLTVLGQITPEELNKVLGQVDWFNGIANRFLWNMVRRSKVLPRQELIPDFTELGQHVSQQSLIPWQGHAKFTDKAGKLWDDFVYETEAQLKKCEPKLRASQERYRPNALRLALVYAQLDRQAKQPLMMDVRHVRAAMAIIKRSRESAAYFLRQPQVTANSEVDLAKVRRILARYNELTLEGKPFTSTTAYQMFRNTADAFERQRLLSAAGLVVVSKLGEQPIVWAIPDQKSGSKS